MAQRSSLQLHSRGRIVMMCVVVAIMIGVSGYLVFEFGRIQADFNIIDSTHERQAFEDRIEQLESDIRSLHEQVTLLETHRDIDRGAYKDVESSLVSLQARIQEQSDEIAFYRGIVSPEDGNSGLRVQKLKLTRGQTERAYNVRLVLVQSLKHDRKVSGNVNLTIEGVQDGTTTSYNFSQLLSSEKNSNWVFSFRYFQDFDREIVLPDGFTPERIKIEIRSRTRSISSIEESFSWATSLG
ncbi:MAG: hypothetical protein IIA11_00820 [Proteobacteria bacterium]|nr:hypothetical protein [Pseudomonadota bacterium]